MKPVPSVVPAWVGQKLLRELEQLADAEVAKAMPKAKDLTLERVLSGVHCFDCHGFDPGYMVHDEIWAQAWPDYHQTRITLRAQFPHPKRILLCLCFNCLEKRLGRSLVLADFTQFPINDGIRFGYRLRDRL